MLKSPSLGVDVVGPVAPGQHRWSAREARPKIFPPRRDPKTRLGGRVLGLHHRSASPPLRRYNSQTCTPPPANIQGVPCKASKCTHFTHLIINIILFIFGLFVAVLGRRRPPEQPASPPDARSTKNEHRCMKGSAIVRQHVFLSLCTLRVDHDTYIHMRVPRHHPLHLHTAWAGGLGRTRTGRRAIRAIQAGGLGIGAGRRRTKSCCAPSESGPHVAFATSLLETVGRGLSGLGQARAGGRFGR